MQDEIFPKDAKERTTEKVFRDAVKLGIGGGAFVAGMYLMVPSALRNMYLAA